MVTSVIRALVSRLLPGCQRVALVLAMLGLLPGPDGFSVQAQAMEVAVLLWADTLVPFSDDSTVKLPAAFELAAGVNLSPA